MQARSFETSTIPVLLMAALGVRRPIVHLPVGLMNTIAAGLETLPNPPLTRGLIAFSVFDNTSHGVNISDVFGLTFRSIDDGVREVYGK